MVRDFFCLRNNIKMQELLQVQWLFGLILECSLKD